MVRPTIISATLNHYEKYDIIEIGRFPSWVTLERLKDLMLLHDQTNHLIELKCEMMVVNVGNYKSILAHALSMPYSTSIEKDLDSNKKL